MDGLNLVDAVVAAVVVISGVLAWSRGLLRETLAIVGWIAAAFAGFMFAAEAEPLIREIPYVGDFLRSSCELSRLAAFSVVFALGLVVMALITPALGSFVGDSILGGVDRSLGFLFGLARGALLIVVALIVYDSAFSGSRVEMIENSASLGVFAGLTTQVEQMLPSDAPGWIAGRYQDLIGHCLPPTAPAPPSGT